MVDKDFGANVANLGSAIVGFAQIVGAANIPAAIAGLHSITDAVHALTDLAAKIPTAAQIADNPIARFNEAAGAAAWDAIKNFDNMIHGKAWGGGAQAGTLGGDGPYMNGGGPGNAFKGAPQPITTTSNVKVDVFVDSELVASKIMSAIESAFRQPHSSAGADGSAAHMPPDAYSS